MSSRRDIEAFLEAYLDNWRLDPPDLTRIFHPEGTLLPPGSAERLDVAGAQRMVEQTRALIPDVTLEILHWAERDGQIFIEWEMQGTLRGRRVRWRGINRNRLRGAKSVEAVSYWDRQGLFEQLGEEAAPEGELLEAIERER